MTIFFRPMGNIGNAPKPRSDSDEELFTYLGEKLGIDVSHSPDSRVDYEDWMEPARMLQAALTLGYEVHVLEHDRLSKVADKPIAIIPGKTTPHMLIGRRLNFDAYEATKMGFIWPPTSADQAKHYAEMDTFRQNAGRDYVICDMPGEKSVRSDYSAAHSPEAADAARTMAKFAGRSIIVKQVLPIKSFPNMSFDLPVDVTPGQCYDMLGDALEFHVALMEGERDALMVQQRIAMHNETRFFVVGHQVAAAAACIESDTPRDTDGDMLQPYFEHVRNDGVVTVGYEWVDILMAKATEVAEAFKENHPEMPCFVLDLAINDRGEAIIIELNPIADAGLYSIKAQDLMQAYIDETLRMAPAFDQDAPSVPIVLPDVASAHFTPSSRPNEIDGMRAAAAKFLAELEDADKDDEPYLEM